jgi:hypothetical protein
VAVTCRPGVGDAEAQVLDLVDGLVEDGETTATADALLQWKCRLAYE